MSNLSIVALAVLTDYWFRIFQIANPSSGQSDQIGFANRSAVSPSKSTPVGAIVGGVIGGLALIAFIIGIVMFLRIQKQKNKKIGDVFDEDLFFAQPKVEPFVYQGDHTQADAPLQSHARTYEPNHEASGSAVELLPPPTYDQVHASGSEPGDSSSYHAPADPVTGRLYKN